MKNIALLIMVSLAFLGCASNKYTGDKHEKAIKKQLEQITKIVEKGDAESLASLMVYRGTDKSRKWKSVCNYDNEQEKAFVDKGLEHIKKCLGSPANYKYKSYESDTESEGTWYVLIVETTYEGQPRDRAFAFLKIDGKYVLGDID